MFIGNRYFKHFKVGTKFISTIQILFSSFKSGQYFYGRVFCLLNIKYYYFKSVTCLIVTNVIDYQLWYYRKFGSKAQKTSC